MALDISFAESLFKDPESFVICNQIAPLGGNRCAILFLVADQDYVETLSVVFVVEDFRPSSAQVILQTDEWLMSLTPLGGEDLMALEATTWIWHYRGGEWSRSKVAKESMRRVWSAGDQKAVLVGRVGLSHYFDGTAWSDLVPDRPYQLFEVHQGRDGAVFCCGSNGTLQLLNNGAWEAVELATSQQFRGLHVDSRDDIRLAGDDGACLRVVNQGELVAIDAPEESTFFCVKRFGDSYYWGEHSFGLFQEVDNALVPFHETGAAFDLRTDDRFMYAIGGARAWRFGEGDPSFLRLAWGDDGFILTDNAP